MKALRLHAPHDLRLHDEPLPLPAAGEELLRISAVGLCGSDLHWYAASAIGDARLQKPLVLGHEFSAVIAEGWRAGTRVAVDPAIPCGECEFCLQGNPNLCPNTRFAGFASQDGALQEYLAWDSRCLFPLPDDLSDADGVMLEPLGVAIHAVDLAHLRPGASVAIFGCGPIGLLILQLVHHMSSGQIFASEPHPHRQQAARRCGADIVLPADGSEAQKILAATRGRGVDVAFEAAGVNAAVDAAVAAVKPGGTVMLAGIPEEERTSFHASTARRKGLTVKWVRRMKHTYPRAIELVQRGVVNVQSLVTHSFPLTEYDTAFSIAHRREGIKVILTF